MIKRLLAALVCVALLMVLLPKTTLAAVDRTLYYSSADSKLHFDGQSGDDYLAGSGTWSGDGSTLKLKNFSYTTEAASALVLPAGTILELEGINTVISRYHDNTETNSYGVYCDGSLTVGGSGTLIAVGGRPGVVSFGISAKDSITVESGILDGRGGQAPTDSYGVHTEWGSMTTTGSGCIKGTGGAATNAQSGSNGVFAGTDIIINGGSITGRGGQAGSVFGVVTANAITINGGSITGICGRASGSNNRSFGFYTLNLELVSGRLVSEVEAVGKLWLIPPVLQEPNYWRISKNAGYTQSVTKQYSWEAAQTYADIRTELPPEDAGADVPKTGDSATPMLWLGIALLAGAALVIRRKRQNG